MQVTGRSAACTRPRCTQPCRSGRPDAPCRARRAARTARVERRGLVTKRAADVRRSPTDRPGHEGASGRARLGGAPDRRRGRLRQEHRSQPPSVARPGRRPADVRRADQGDQGRDAGTRARGRARAPSRTGRSHTRQQNASRLT